MTAHGLAAAGRKSRPGRKLDFLGVTAVQSFLHLWCYHLQSGSGNVIAQWPCSSPRDGSRGALGILENHLHLSEM